MMGIHSSSRRFETALAWYRRALELGSEDADIHFALGNLLYRWGRLDDAEELLRSPGIGTTGERRRNRGMHWAWCCGRAMRFGEAERCFRKAIKIGTRGTFAPSAPWPTRARCWRVSGGASLMPGQPISSAAAYEEMDQAWHDYKRRTRPAGAAYPRGALGSYGTWLSLGVELSACRGTTKRGRRCKRRSAFARKWARRRFADRYRDGDNLPPRRRLRVRPHVADQGVEAAPEDAGVHIFPRRAARQWGRFDEANASHRPRDNLRGRVPDDLAQHRLILRAQDRLAESAEWLRARPWRSTATTPPRRTRWRT